jgi:RHH-type rel operon transcriptional repressor/antitoxin RelB
MHARRSRQSRLSSLNRPACYLKHMLGIRLEPELEQQLESLAKQTGRSKSYYARQAIRQYLENREDYLKGIAALKRRELTISLAELERRLGLAD